MRAAALPVLALLAACSAEPAPQPGPTATATVAAPRTLVAADFDPASLGGLMVDMGMTDGEVGGGLARVTTLVACPKAMTSCDPATTPEGTMFTYALTITPQLAAATPAIAASAGEEAETGAVPVEAPAELIGMTRAAAGFNGAVGYSRAEAAAALGNENALSVTLDQDRLIWRVTGGSGWASGKPLTVWWQSTARPARPTAAYRLDYAGKDAAISAPFPAAADKPDNR